MVPLDVAKNYAREQLPRVEAAIAEHERCRDRLLQEKDALETFLALDEFDPACRNCAGTGEVVMGWKGQEYMNIVPCPVCRTAAFTMRMERAG